MTDQTPIRAALSSALVPTFTGHLVDLLAPRPEDISLRDVAHALAGLNRWSGHLQSSISVAQHTLLVAAHVPADCRVHALLHDAHEAYTGESPSPMKAAQRLVEMAGGYRDDVGSNRCIELGLDAAIYHAVGLPLPNAAQRDAIHTADRRAAATEARDLLTRTEPMLDFGAEPFRQQISPWKTVDSEARLVTAFRQQFPQRQELWSR